MPCKHKIFIHVLHDPHERKSRNQHLVAHCSTSVPSELQFNSSLILVFLPGHPHHRLFNSKTYHHSLPVSPWLC